MSRLFTFEARRRRVTLRVDTPPLLSLAEKLHSCARVTAGMCEANAPADLAWSEVRPKEFGIELFGRLWETGLDAGAVFFQSENLVTQIFSQRHSDSLQIHAGAVMSPEGAGWLIAGESGSGKTSLTLALMLEGWPWLSDELVLVERTTPGEIAGVPRNFNLKERSFEYFPETSELTSGLEILSPKRRCLVRFIDPEALVPKRFAPEAPLGAILFPKHTPNLRQPTLRRCQGAELSGRLLSTIFQSPPWAVEWIVATAGKVPAWEFCCNEPRAAARFLRKSPLGQRAETEN